MWRIRFSSTAFESSCLEDRGIPVPFSLAPPYPWVCPRFGKAEANPYSKLHERGEADQSQPDFLHVSGYTHSCWRARTHSPESQSAARGSPPVVFPHPLHWSVVGPSREAVLGSFS